MIDSVIFNFLNGLAGEWLLLDYLGVFLASYLPYLVVIFIVFTLFKNVIKYWKAVIVSSGAGLFSLLIGYILKIIVERPRPFMVKNVNLLIDPVGVFSFPSTHASFFFALSFSFYFYNKKTGGFLLLLSFLISIARVFTGAHWPSDILMGILVGFISAVIIRLAAKKVRSFSKIN